MKCFACDCNVHVECDAPNCDCEICEMRDEVLDLDAMRKLKLIAG